MKWTESVGICLVERDLTVMTITAPNGHRFSYDVLQLFPFTSERKRMGIIVRVSLLKMNVIFFSPDKNFWLSQSSSYNTIKAVLTIFSIKRISRKSLPQPVQGQETVKINK